MLRSNSNSLEVHKCLDKKTGRTPRYIHIGELPESDYKELCSESKIIVKNPRTKRDEYRWVAHGRNELLDTTIYCLALIHYLYGKWTSDDYEEQKRYDLQQIINDKQANSREDFDSIRGLTKPSHRDNFGEPYDWS